MSSTPFNNEFDIERIQKFNQPKLEQIIATGNLCFQNSDFRKRFEVAINPNTEVIYVI